MELFFDHPRLNIIWRNAFESIAFRQDSYTTGGIVESDVRVSPLGGTGYWPWCWARNYIVEPLLEAGEWERCRKWLNFFLECGQRHGWKNFHCFDVRNYRPWPSNWPETDNIGYFLYYAEMYITRSGDDSWFWSNSIALEEAAEHIVSAIDSETGLVHGLEEMCIYHDGHFIDTPVNFGTHVNFLCAAGLQAISKMFHYLDDSEEKTARYAMMAEKVLTAVDRYLFKKEAGFEYYSIGAAQNLEAVAGNLRQVNSDVEFVVYPGCHSPWMQLAKAIIWRCWDDKLEYTWRYIKQRLQVFGEELPGTYWWGSPLDEYKEHLPEPWMPINPTTGQHAMIAWALLEADHPDEAVEFVEVSMRYVKAAEHYLPGESVSTEKAQPIPRYPFRKGYPKSELVRPDTGTSYRHNSNGSSRGMERNMVPDSSDSDTFYSRDPGNLLHLSAAVNLMVRFIGRLDGDVGFAPRLPDNLHFIKVEDWPVQGTRVSFEYRSDAPASHGAASLIFNGCLPGPFKVGLRVGSKNIRRVMLNQAEIPVVEDKITESSSGTVFRYWLELQPHGKTIDLEVIW